MKRWVSRSSNRPSRLIVYLVAAMAMILIVMAVAIFFFRGQKAGALILEDPQSKTQYAAYEMAVGEVFSVEFIHSVNKSPVIDYFEIRADGIYGIKTVYYGFGAGVPTEVGEGQTLSYGEDGSMILSGFALKLDPLVYRVGTVSDHILTLPDGKKISLRDLCGRNARVGFLYENERTPVGTL